MQSSRSQKMPEVAKECGNQPPSPNELTDGDKLLVRETWKEAAKPEVQAGQKLFKRQVTRSVALIYRSRGGGLPYNNDGGVRRTV